jgi:type IV secretory pathway VirB6-like protein
MFSLASLSSVVELYFNGGPPRLESQGSFKFGASRQVVSGRGDAREGLQQIRDRRSKAYETMKFRGSRRLPANNSERRLIAEGGEKRKLPG